MNSFSLIEEIQEKVVEIYRHHDIFPLRGRIDDFKHDDFDSFDLFYSSVDRNETKRGLHSFYFDLFHDLIFCSDEIVYFTAHLYLYRPFINNPIDDVRQFVGQELFPNYQNIPAKRFNMYADVASQKTYNFWDRIGDLIASYFPDKFPPKKPVYFANAVEAIPLNYRDDSNFKWLNDFKKSGYNEMNRMRKSIVHHFTTDTLYLRAQLQNASNREEMERVQKERSGIPEFYQLQNRLTIEGYKRTLELLKLIGEDLK